MATLYEFLAILNTRRYTDDEWKELDIRLKELNTDTLQQLYFVAADKDEEVNTPARYERRHQDISRRWETLRMKIKQAYDHAKIRENKGPWILSTEHTLDILWRSTWKFKSLFNPPA